MITTEKGDAITFGMMFAMLLIILETSKQGIAGLTGKYS